MGNLFCSLCSIVGCSFSSFSRYCLLLATELVQSCTVVCGCGWLVKGCSSYGPQCLEVSVDWMVSSILQEAHLSLRDSAMLAGMPVEIF